MDRKRILVKIVGDKEYQRLLEVLQQKNFHLASGRDADKPSTFFRTMVDQDGRDVIGVRSLNFGKKIIGYYPIEVFSDCERVALMDECLSVDETMKLLEKDSFYFSFGSAEQFPYHDGYLIVKADGLDDAISKFRRKYPDIHENCINCAFFYSESEWKGLQNSNATCHEIIW